jgi:hypothetical protein
MKIKFLSLKIGHQAFWSPTFYDWPLTICVKMLNLASREWCIEFATLLILCCDFWANEDTNTFSTSKWPSEPYFCERYKFKYQCSYFDWLENWDLKRKFMIFSPVANLMHHPLWFITTVSSKYAAEL